MGQGVCISKAACQPPMTTWRLPDLSREHWMTSRCQGERLSPRQDAWLKSIQLHRTDNLSADSKHTTKETSDTSIPQLQNTKRADQPCTTCTNIHVCTPNVYRYVYTYTQPAQLLPQPPFLTISLSKGLFSKAMLTNNRPLQAPSMQSCCMSTENHSGQHSGTCHLSTQQVKSGRVSAGYQLQSENLSQNKTQGLRGPQGLSTWLVCTRLGAGVGEKGEDRGFECLLLQINTFLQSY